MARQQSLVINKKKKKNKKKEEKKKRLVSGGHPSKLHLPILLKRLALMIIDTGNGISYLNSKLGWRCLHLTLH